MDTTTDVSTSGKSITFTSTREDVNIDSERKNVGIASYKNVNISSDVDSINLTAKNCVNLESTDKSINLLSDNGMIITTASDLLKSNSINGNVIVKSNRQNLNLETFRDMEVFAEQGNITIEAPNGTINIRAHNNINITPGDDAQVYVAGNFRATAISQGSATSESGLLVPTGTVVPYCGTSSPIGWFICDGSSYDTVIYRTLFLVIGYTFGGSGSNFYVPDMRGRVTVGSSTGISGIVNKSVGATGGAETHTLTVQEMPAHTHTVDTDISSWESSAYSVLGAPDRPNRGSNTTTTSSTGGGQAHTIMQPYMTLNYIVKY